MEPNEITRGRTDLVRLGEIVASSQAALGVRFDPVGERLSLVDERGKIIEDGTKQHQAARRTAPPAGQPSAVTVHTAAGG